MKSSQHRSSGNFKGSKLSAKTSEEAITCPLHGPNAKHSLSECKVMIAQAERMRAMHMAKSGVQKQEERKNKRKFDSDSKFSKFKEEVNALVEQKLSKAKLSDQSQSSSDEDEQINAFQQE